MTKEEEIEMQHVKSTKSTDVYEPVDQTRPACVTSLYVQKWFSQGIEKLTIKIQKGE